MVQFVVVALNCAAVILELVVVILEYALVTEHFHPLIAVLVVDTLQLKFEEKEGYGFREYITEIRR